MKKIFQYKCFQLILAWYDMWIGAYYDVGHKTLYIIPFPMVVLRFEFRGKKNELLHRRDRASIVDRHIENLADKFGIYEGKYNNGERDMFCREENRHKTDCNCRLCFNLEMRSLIEKYIGEL